MQRDYMEIAEVDDCSGCLLRHRTMEKLRSWSAHEFLHMKRESNQSAYRLASEALKQEKGTVVVSDQVCQGLITINRLG